MATRRIQGQKFQAARDTAVLPTEAIRELTIPQHMVICVKRLESSGKVQEFHAASVYRTAMACTIIGLCRLNETRKYFPVPLPTDREVTALGLPDIETFVRDWETLKT